MSITPQGSLFGLVWEGPYQSDPSNGGIDMDSMLDLTNAVVALNL